MCVLHVLHGCAIRGKLGPSMVTFCVYDRFQVVNIVADLAVSRSIIISE